MTKKYEALSATKITSGCRYAHPNSLPEIAHFDDPAIEVMLDFKIAQPITVGLETLIDDALKIMQDHNVHMLLVVDTNDELKGMLSAEDMLGEKPIIAAQKQKLNHDEIAVKMVMTPLENIMAIDMKHIKIASVGSVFNTMKDCKQHYIFTVGTADDDKQCIRGLFASSMLGKLLGKQVDDLPSRAQTLAAMTKRLSKK